MCHKFQIRPGERKDIEEILEIFNSARKYMRANNNWSQWSDNYPGESDIEADIKNGNCFVGVDSDGRIFMTFAFILGEDPTYEIIKDGQWLNHKPYGTVHRIASNGKFSGVLQKACEFGFRKIDNIRIDTHEDNAPMLKALENLGFVECGVINCRDGSPRLAFQKENSGIAISPDSIFSR